MKNISRYGQNRPIPWVCRAWYRQQVDTHRSKNDYFGLGGTQNWYFWKKHEIDFFFFFFLHTSSKVVKYFIYCYSCFVLTEDILRYSGVAHITPKQIYYTATQTHTRAQAHARTPTHTHAHTHTNLHTMLVFVKI